MIGSPQMDAKPHVRRIEAVAPFDLRDDERRALAALPMHVVGFEAHQDIVCEHDRPTCCFAVLSGIVATYKTTGSGGRQIVAYHVTGDVPDFQSLHLEVLDISIAAATPCQVGLIRHEAVRTLLREHPRLKDVLWRVTLLDGALYREWMLNNGRRESYARMAHLFCELLTRLEVVGLARGDACELGLTQPELGDALGISVVHVSRTLKELREAGLITLAGGRLTVHDRARLAAVAEFDPTYLHLRRRTA